MQIPETIKAVTNVFLVQEAAWRTARKKDGDFFSPSLFYNYLIAEHSPIRRFIVSWRYSKLPKRVSTHLARHVHQLPFVSSTRPDWFNDHDKDEYVDHTQDANAQALIDMARKRLCYRAWRPTQEVVEGIKYSLMMSSNNYLVSLGQVLVPNCVYRGGCPEGKRSCSWFKRKENLHICNIKKRYEIYNEDFIFSNKVGIQ